MTDLVLRQELKDYLPDYSQIDYNLPTMKQIFSESTFTCDEVAVDTAIAALSSADQATLETSFITLCGWSHETLLKLAAEKNVHWLDVFFDEINNDEENPFKETGRFITDWAALKEPERNAVDAIYVLIFNRAMSDVLSQIINAIEAELFLS